MEILNILIMGLLLSLSLGEFGRYIFPMLGNSPILFNDVIVAVTVSTYFMTKKVKKKPMLLQTPILIFLGICVVSLLLNMYLLSLSELGISALYILRWGLYAGLYFVFRDSNKIRVQKSMHVLMSVGQIIVGIGYIQFIFYPSLGNLFYLGWDNHLYRMFSVFLDPNFAGIFFVLVFLLTVGQSWQAYVTKKKNLATFLSVLAFFDLVAVYLTYSRSALIALFCAVVVLLWIKGRKKILLIVLAIMIAAIFFSPKSFQTEGTNLLRIASFESRMITFTQALTIFEKNPLYGVGFNAYRFAQHRYGFLSGKYWVDSHGGSSTDNSYLFILATTGIIGFISYVFLLYQCIKVSLKEKSMLTIITFCSLVAIFVSSFFNNSLFYIFIMEWMWIMVGLTESNSL